MLCNDFLKDSAAVVYSKQSRQLLGITGSAGSFDLFHYAFLGVQLEGSSYYVHMKNRSLCWKLTSRKVKITIYKCILTLFGVTTIAIKGVKMF